MKKPTQHQIGAFIVYAFPVYLPLVLSVIAIFVLKIPLNNPFLISLLLIDAAVLGSALMMVKKHWWVCLPMLALGIFIALQQDQHIPIGPFGGYMILHYAAWGLYLYRKKKNAGELEQKIWFYCGIFTVLFCFWLIYNM